MKGKILLVVGLGVGYILGSRAGRERYEQIKAAASKVWNDPHVQKQVNSAEEFIKDKAPDVAEFLADGAKKIVSQVAGRPSKPTAPARSAAETAKTTAPSSAAKPAAKKPAAKKPVTKKPASTATSKPAASK